MNKPHTLMTTCLIGLLFVCSAQAADTRQEIQFPDLPSHQTLVCDLHMHTVYSDGLVWPTVRVAEAWRQGIDVISITDHIEYQPHKNDLPTNHNRPYDLAQGHAKAHGILLARAAEITRDTPPGHFNAIFLKDVNPLDTENLLDAVKNANEQGAFLFWNHQGWKGEEKGVWLDVHTKMFDNGWLHGMEVANGSSYFPTAHKWCLEKNLTMMGNSDIHDADRRVRNENTDHRTMTLVFSKERTLKALKEALHQGQTVVWHKEQLIGRKKWLEPLFAQCVQIAPVHLQTQKDIYVQIRNVCEADIQLIRTSGGGPADLTLPARSTSLVKIPTPKTEEPMKLEYQAVNFVVAPGTGLPVVLQIAGP